MPTRYGDDTSRPYDASYDQLLPGGGVLVGRYGFGRDLAEYGSEAAIDAGLKPYADLADEWVAEADLKEVINRCNEERSFPEYHILRTPLSDPNNTNQDGLNFCWSWGAGNMTMGVREIQKLPFVRLAPVTLGWLVNWRNAGFYCDATMEAMQKYGMASVEMVKDAGEHNRNHNQYDPRWEQDRLNYRLGESWDIDCRRTDMEILRQKITIMRAGGMIYGGLDWWGHALGVVGARWNEGEYLNVELKYWNSHRDGLITLTGKRMILDVGFGFRSAQLPG